MEHLNMAFDSKEPPREVKITTEHEIGDALLAAIGLDDADEEVKQLVLQELPNVGDYIKQPILDAIQIEIEARNDPDEEKE